MYFSRQAPKTSYFFEFIISIFYTKIYESNVSKRNWLIIISNASNLGNIRAPTYSIFNILCKRPMS